MKLKERFKAFMNGNVTENGKQGISVFKPSGNVMPSMPELTFLQAFRGWSAKCIDMRSTSVSLKRNYGVYLGADGKGKPVPQTHWINQLIKTPNKPLNLPFEDIKKLLIEWLDFHGNAYLWFPLNGGKYPTQMWVLESNRVWINPGKDKLIESYSYSNHNGVFEIPPSEICHFKTLHPSNKMYGSQFEGSSLYLAAALNAILSDEKKREFLQGFYDSDGTLFMTINAPKDGGIENTEFLDQFKQQTARIPNINRKVIGYMPDGITLNPAPFSPLSAVAVSNDMASDNNSEMICTIFGVPKTLITGTGANYATAAIAEKTYQEQTAEPLISRFESTLTMYLNQFDPELQITHVPYVFSDPQTEIAKRTFDFRNGVVNRNELRAADGKDAIPDGEIYFIESSLIPVDMAINPPEQILTAPKKVPEPIKNYSTEKKNPILN